MFKKRVVTILSGLVIVVLAVLSACTPDDYEQLKDDLSEVRGQLEQAQADLAEYQETVSGGKSLTLQYQDLSSRYATLESDFQAVQTRLIDSQGQLETLRQQYNALDNDFRALQTEHDALLRDYDLLTAAEISAGDVEQMLFDLINQERIAGGRAELAWGKNLYSYAISNSRNMAANQSHEQSSYASWQDVHWAAGYRTADDLVNATMIIWQNSPQYQQNILNAVPTYGAVAVYQSGDIFYITYMSSQFQ